MESINSNPYFNPAHLPNAQTTGTSRNAANPSSHLKTNAHNAVPQANQSEPFSNMFDDEQLAKLQSNLEEIASQAERALKRFSSDSL